jgi:hypothetical protein
MSKNLSGAYNAGMLLEFMSGIKLANVDADKFNENTRQELVKLLETDIRNQIEVNLPVIYWVKPIEIISNQVNGLMSLINSNNPNLGKDYIESIDVDGTEIVQGQPRFNEELAKKLSNLTNNSGFNQRLLDAIKTATKGNKISMQQLGERAKHFEDRLSKSSSNINLIVSIGTPTDVSNLRTALTNEIQRIGFDFKQWLNSIAPAELLNPQDYVVGFDPATEIIFLGGNFKSARGTTVNKTCQKFFADELPKLGIKPRKTFSIGDFTAAGHAGAAFRTGGIKEIQGINTPLTQEILFLAEQEGKGLNKAAMQPFRNIEDHIDLSIEFTTQVKPETINSLLYLNFSFLVTQEAAWNGRLGTEEKITGGKIVESIFKRKKKQLTDAFKERLFRAIKDTAVGYFTNSPTIRQLIGELLANSIKTGKTKSRAPTKGSASLKGKPALFANEKIGKPAKNPGKIKLPQTTKTSSNTNTVGMSNMGNTTVAPVNLLNLMNIINTHLQNVISSNMGDGNSKNVLNYRTGRFAASAQVERMSYGKEGTITAFYNYMKNPYATFSAGGKQSRPTSRDPKILISASIREIAQGIVSNKLRAVSV